MNFCILIHNSPSCRLIKLLSKDDHGIDPVYKRAGLGSRGWRHILGYRFRSGKSLQVGIAERKHKLSGIDRIGTSLHPSTLSNEVPELGLV